MKKPSGDEIIKFLDVRWRGATCPLCGGRGWNVADKIFELREYNDGELIIGGAGTSIVPVIPVTCDTCGNTVFINALSTGLMKE